MCFVHSDFRATVSGLTGEAVRFIRLGLVVWLFLVAGSNWWLLLCFFDEVAECDVYVGLVGVVVREQVE